ncbi:MAG TPA: deoxyribodipyrimidine photo-lyase, partial [Campylobacterales bacterium]|nr:deoxyribodipyrimidine photo-lyase [Campylobacterales bacterium]
MNEQITSVKVGNLRGKRVLYWMSREQRVEANFGLLAASEYANKRGLTLVVAFCVAPEFLGAAPEAFSFMGEGLKEVEGALVSKNIPFKLLYGNPSFEIVKFALMAEAEAIFCDFDPLRVKKAWQKELKEAFDGSIYEVDSHNIIPARFVSNKKEFAAYTIRPKIHKLLPQFLIAPPQLAAQDGVQIFYQNDFLALDILPKNSYFTSGRTAAIKRLNEFLETKLDGYAAYRNDPTKDYQSGLSVYLHFGQISSLEIAIRVKEVNANEQSKEAFLEELIVRK